MKEHSNRIIEPAWWFCWLIVVAAVNYAGCQESKSRARLDVIQVMAFSNQRLYCSKDYFASACKQHALHLQKLLRKYRAEALGRWDWVLIHSDDWKPLLQQLRLDPTSPAITSLPDRKTLFDESLFSASAARRTEFLHAYLVPFDQLLALAVSHELGHALCRELSESSASHFAEQIRNNRRPNCQSAHIRHFWDGKPEALTTSPVWPRVPGLPPIQ